MRGKPTSWYVVLGVVVASTLVTVLFRPDGLPGLALAAVVVFYVTFNVLYHVLLFLLLGFRRLQRWRR